MKLVLGSDLDGTLIRDNIIPTENIKSLEKLNSAGGMFIISTGRPFNGVSYLIDEYKLDVNYKILLNGALILDNSNKPILHKTIPFDYIEKIFSYVKTFNPSISLENGFKTYLMEEDVFNLPYSGKEVIQSLDDIDNEEISLISLYFADAKIEIIEEICESINNTFNSECVAFRNTNFIDVVPKNCSKGSALLHLCNLENIDKNNLYTIGDSFNDISMFDITDNSFTFHECEDKLKSYASNIVESVSECIENHMLIK